MNATIVQHPVTKCNRQSWINIYQWIAVAWRLISSKIVENHFNKDISHSIDCNEDDIIWEVESDDNNQTKESDFEDDSTDNENKSM